MQEFQPHFGRMGEAAIGGKGNNKGNPDARGVSDQRFAIGVRLVAADMALAVAFHL
jgi:hypothetical protein